MSDILKDKLSGVIPTSPSESDDIELEGDQLEPEATPEGDEPVEGADKKPERTIDQVHKEFDRKISKLARSIDEKLDRLTNQFRAPATTTPSSESSDPLDKYSIAELRQMRKNLTDDGQKDILDEYLINRTVSERVNASLNKFTSEQKYSSSESEANRTAVTRYPDLLNDTTEFYATVHSRIHALGRQYVDANPRAILDVANEVAIEMGVSPKTGIRGRRRAPGNSPTRRDKNDPTPIGEAATISDAEIEKISARLQRALPPGKKFDKVAIKKQHTEYTKHKDLIIRG